MDSFSSLRAAAAFLILAGSCSVVCQQSHGSSAAPQMIGGPIAPGVFVSVSREPEGASVLRIQSGEQSWSVSLPYATITAATSRADDVLVAGILPNQNVEYRLLVLSGGRWVTSGIGAPTRNLYVARMSWRDARLAMLLADGSIVSAPCAATQAVPTGEDFELVGVAPPGVIRSLRIAGLDVIGSDRIEVYLHPSNRHAFARQPSGNWTSTPADGSQTPVLRIEQPARLDNEMHFFAATSGPLILEEDGTTAWWPVVNEVPLSGRGVLPRELSSVLHPDRRYRLKSHELIGPWFYPAAIAGVAWAAPGLDVGECSVFESGVRIERGSLTAGTTLHFSRDPDTLRVFKVAFVATTTEAAPPTTMANGHTWLVPDRALVAEKALAPKRRTYELAMAVPIPEDPVCVGGWIHVQIVVLDADGTPLGGTGVRSVRILPNKGTWPVAREQAARGSAVRYWASHGVGDPLAFWRIIVGQ